MKADNVPYSWCWGSSLSGITCARVTLCAPINLLMSNVGPTARRMWTPHVAALSQAHRASSIPNFRMKSETLPLINCI